MKGDDGQTPDRSCTTHIFDMIKTRGFEVLRLQSNGRSTKIAKTIDNERWMKGDGVENKVREVVSRRSCVGWQILLSQRPPWGLMYSSLGDACLLATPSTCHLHNSLASIPRTSSLRNTNRHIASCTRARKALFYKFYIVYTPAQLDGMVSHESIALAQREFLGAFGLRIS